MSSVPPTSYGCVALTKPYYTYIADVQVLQQDAQIQYYSISIKVMQEESPQLKFMFCSVKET
jgi:hypothetical protein